MKITKRSYRFLLLAVSVLVLGIMFVGCDLSMLTVGGVLVVGGVIGNSQGHVFIGIIVGGIIGCIIFMILSRFAGTGSDTSVGASQHNWMESRKNDPHTCGNCAKYSSQRGECRFDGEPKSAGDHCGRWC